MKDYYNILGLQYGAKQSEIKKAYFKLIRQYTPESDPERFMEIREAYETLKSGENDAIYSLQVPDDPLAISLLEKIMAHEQSHQYKKAVVLSQEALQHFPDAPRFRYMLGYCQLKAGNTGNAIKTFEALAGEDPENRHYQQWLANAYLARGFTKKAFPVFKKAYALGCRDNDFVLSFSMLCQSNHEPETGRQTLLTMVQSDQKKTQDVMDDLVEAYLLIYELDNYCEQTQAEMITDNLYAFFKNWSYFLDENAEEILPILFAATISLSVAHSTYKLADIMALLDESLQSDESKHLLKSTKKIVEGIRLSKDERIPFDRSLMAQRLITPPTDPEMETFLEIDAKLCMMEELPEILESFIILEADYPACFEIFSDFILALRENKNLKSLKDKLLNAYDWMDSCFSGGLYYQKYPHMKHKHKHKQPFFPQFEHREPFVNSEPKIGRNDPCPCGSGKKYKRCCGK